MSVNPNEINFDSSLMSDNGIPVSTQWTLDATGDAGRAAIKSVYMLTCPTTGSKGSGFLLSNGYIVTNVHVIKGEQIGKICAIDSSNKQIGFTQIHSDQERDIAILKPNITLKDGLDLDLTESIKLGESVYTWGYPLGHNGPSPLLSVGYLAGIKAHQELYGCNIRLMQDEKADFLMLNKNLNEIGIVKDGADDKFKIFYRKKSDNAIDTHVIQSKEAADTLSGLVFNGQITANSEATKKVFSFIYNLVTQQKGHTHFSKAGVQKRLVVNGAFNSGNSGGGLFKANEKKIIGIVVNKHAPVLSKYQQSAIDALANNKTGFNNFKAIDGNGNEKLVLESQIVAELLNSFRGMVQVVIGEAICSSELIKVLVANANYINQEAMKKVGEKKHDEAIVLLLEAKNILEAYKPTDEILMLIYFNLGKSYLNNSKAVEAYSAFIKSEEICKVQLQTPQNQQNHLAIIQCIAQAKSALPVDIQIKSQTFDPDGKLLLNMVDQGSPVGKLIKEFELKDTSQEELERGLRKAACDNKLEALKKFVKLVENVDAKDLKQGKTALHWAVSKNHLACIQELLNAGANPAIKDNDEKMAENYTTNEEVLKLLKLEKKTPVNA